MRFWFRRRKERKGAISVLCAILLVPLMGILALAIDYGYLLKTRTDLQRAADAAALAAVQKLVPDSEGYQDLNAARDAVVNYVKMNMDLSFQVRDADIEIGRFDASKIYSNVVLVNSGVYDAVRVTVRYDEAANAPVSLFFARVIGIDDAEVSATATAILQKASSLGTGADILPIAVPLEAWEKIFVGDDWNIYGDGKLTSEFGDEIPGNWGTVDINSDDNSNSDLVDQIRNGLRQEDLDELYDANRIPSPTKIDADEPLWVNADTGLSSGMKSAVREVHGKTRIVPIYDWQDVANGNNLEFHVVGWGSVTVIDSHWKGNKDTFITIRKSYLYDGDILPHRDLRQTVGVIEGAYTSPILVE